MYKNYNMNQVILPLDFEMKLAEKDIAFSIHHLVESIPEEAFAPFYKATGCPSYHPKMMLKIILCGYTQSIFSGRRMEDLTKDSVRMMWLAQGYEPSYRTINRFRVHPQMQELLKQCFIQFRCRLIEEKCIDQQAIFIDGTKIEANANKFTFVWKKSVENYQASMIEKSNTLYEQLVEERILPAIQKEQDDALSSEELEQVASTLEEVIDDYTEKLEASSDSSERKQLRAARKTPKQYLKQVKDWIVRKRQYRLHLQQMGTRNSYSKTDVDATFMRMKDDYMKNGQLKPGYNVQIATENQYVLAYEVYPNPTDTKTLVPFLQDIQAHYFELPEHIVADAGYGSEPNYQYVVETLQRKALITYGMYRKEQQRKYLKDPFKTSNWAYDATTDCYTCPNGQLVKYQYDSTRTDKTGFTRHFKIYTCEDCSGCPFRSSCTKAREGNNRRLAINTHWEEQKKMIQATLSEAKTGAIYRKRKIDVEPVFGFLKANLGFTRFSLRGKSKVRNEIGRTLMATNLRKYAMRG